MAFYVIIFVIILIVIIFIIMRKNKRELEVDREFTGKSSKEELKYYDNGIFELEIEDVFQITGRGIVVTGKIKSGIIRKNDKVIILSEGKKAEESEILGIEAFRKKLDTAAKGDHVGLYLKNSRVLELKKGDKITK